MKKFFKHVTSLMLAIAVFLLSMPVYSFSGEYGRYTVVSVNSVTETVSNGTPAKNWNLPSEVKVNLQDINGVSTTQNCEIDTWNLTAFFDPSDDKTSTTYDPNKKEEQVLVVYGSFCYDFSVQNLDMVFAKATVTVSAALASPITSIDLSNISVSNGTSVENWPLPSEVSYTTDSPENPIGTSSVAWNLTTLFDPSNDKTPVNYDPNKADEQTLVVFGDLYGLPEGITNSNSIRAKATITVLAVTPDTSYKITSINSPNISVSNGTPIENWPLPLKVSYTTNASENSVRSSFVNWDLTAFFAQDGKTEINYDSNKKEEQILVVFGKLQDLPDHITNPDEIVVRLDVTILAKGDPSSAPSNEIGTNTSSDSEIQKEDNKTTSNGNINESLSNIFEQWVTVTLDGDHAHLFGIITTTDVIEPGSNFFVNVVKDEKNLLDKDVSVKNIKFLDIGVIKPSGEKYEGNLKSAVDIYCQWPSEWNKENHAMLKLNSSKDEEQLFIGFTDFDNVAYANYKFSEFTPPYALIEKNSNDNKWLQIALISLGVLAICGVGGWIYYKKCKKLESI